jgi:hypothetical protein
VTDAPDHPSVHHAVDRYGRPPPWRRTAVAVAVVVVVAAGLGWLLVTALSHANPEVTSKLIGWEVVDDHSVTARIDVDMRDDVSAMCRVKAYAEDHTVVGEFSFVPEHGRNQIEFRTERRATSVESSGCTAPDQPRPR